MYFQKCKQTYIWLLFGHYLSLRSSVLAWPEQSICYIFKVSRNLFVKMEQKLNCKLYFSHDSKTSVLWKMALDYDATAAPKNFSIILQKANIVISLEFWLNNIIIGDHSSVLNNIRILHTALMFTPLYLYMKVS